jgi:hypothetical protein
MYRDTKLPRPSSAILVAVMALVAALGGTALAGPGASSSALSKKTVKKIATKQADARIAALAPGLSVARAQTAGSADTADSAATATSADTAESAEVAGNADAVGGQKITKIFAKIPADTTGATVATVDGLTIRATCTPGGLIEDLLVDPPTTDADLLGQGNGNAGPVFDQDGGAEPNEISLDQGESAFDNVRGMSTFSAARTGGSVITGMIGYDNPPVFNGELVCAVYGHVISG